MKFWLTDWPSYLIASAPRPHVTMTLHWLLNYNKLMDIMVCNTFLWCCPKDQCGNQCNYGEDRRGMSWHFSWRRRSKPPANVTLPVPAFYLVSESVGESVSESVMLLTKYFHASDRVTDGKYRRNKFFAWDLQSPHHTLANIDIEFEMKFLSDMNRMI